MFNYKAASNLVGFIGTIKILAMVLTILGGVAGAVSSVAAYGIHAQNDTLATFGVVVSLVAAAFWTAVVWAVFGLLQHHLAAVSLTAHLAGERAKLGI
jgi:ABC-type transport system involved in cytochrome c biogenesis permease subunit